MDWNTVLEQFPSQLLAALGLKAVAHLLSSISKSILLGGTFLQPKLGSVPRQGQSQARIYTASDLLDLWRDIYGPTWTWDMWRNKRSIYEGTRLELRGVTLHEYLSTRPGFRYTLRQGEYQKEARQYFPGSYENVAEELDSLSWGSFHQDIGLLDIRYASRSVGNERLHLLGATAGAREDSPSSFPIVVGDELYRNIVEGLRLYGAVRVERITGEIKMGDKRLESLFMGEPHRDPLFLHADEGQRIIVLDSPHRILADAWTVAEIDGEQRILAFTFPLGTLDWETQLMAKCQAVEDFCKKHGGCPLVDFDAQQRHFSTAKYDPGIIQDYLAKSQISLTD